MLHVKSNVKYNSESVFRYFASGVNSNQSTKCNRKDLYAVVIQALKKSVMFLCTPFANRCLIYSDWAFEITLHSPSIHKLSSPDHRSVRNKEVKFIRIYSLEPRFSVLCPYQTESVLQRFFLKRTYENFVGTLETVRNREVSV